MAVRGKKKTSTRRHSCTGGDPGACSQSHMPSPFLYERRRDRRNGSTHRRTVLSSFRHFKWEERLTVRRTNPATSTLTWTLLSVSNIALFAVSGYCIVQTPPSLIPNAGPCIDLKPVTMAGWRPSCRVRPTSCGVGTEQPRSRRTLEHLNNVQRNQSPVSPLSVAPATPPSLMA